MKRVHWHLVVNHLPIIFPLVGIIILITGIISQSEAVKRTAFLIFMIGAVSSIVAMSTGEKAEVVVEKISGITESMIEPHEEAAEIFAVLTYILGGISLVGLWASFKQKAFAKAASLVALVFAFIALFFAKQTGTTGGEIRHTEIRMNQ